MPFGNLIEMLQGDDSEEIDLDTPDDFPQMDEPDDPGDLLEPDPAPKRRGRAARFTAPSSSASSKVTAAQRKTVEDALYLIQVSLATPFLLRDPYCPKAVKDNARATAKAAAPIICRHPSWLSFFIGSSAPWLEYIGVITAFGPVLSVIVGHHVTHTIGHDEHQEDGHGPFGSPDFGSGGGSSQYDFSAPTLAFG